MAVRKALGDGATIDPDLARDADVPLKSLIAARVGVGSAA
jgi:hypothetical protein